MISNDEAKRLHDSATRGLSLSAEEQAALAAWYRREDEVEARIINGESDILTPLYARIQTTEAENARLRNEIAEIRYQLANIAHRSDSMSISELEDYEDRLARGEIKW